MVDDVGVDTGVVMNSHFFAVDELIILLQVAEVYPLCVYRVERRVFGADLDISVYEDRLLKVDSWVQRATLSKHVETVDV